MGLLDTLNRYNQVAERSIKNPRKAIGNAYSRMTNTPQYQAGAGGIPTWENVKQAFTPYSIAQASESSPGLVQTGGDYSIRAKINSDGQTVGFDYFFNGQPITEQEYTNAGMNLANDQELAYKDLQINTQKQQLTQPTGETSGTGDTGETAPAEVPQVWTFNGTNYTDPTAYSNAVTEASIAEFNRQNKLLTDAYNAGLLEFSTYQDQIKQSRSKIKEDYDTAMSAIGGRFSALSPEAYQSSQGKSEGRAKDITDQNYANVSTEEANLGLRKSQYDQDYANNLESNRISSQNQIDQTVNDTRSALADTSYANSVGSINAPKLSTMTPMDSSILGNYDALSQLSTSGNIPAVRQKISELNVEPDIRDWLYTRFASQTA